MLYCSNWRISYVIVNLTARVTSYWSLVFDAEIIMPMIISIIVADFNANIGFIALAFLMITDCF